MRRVLALLVLALPLGTARADEPLPPLVPEPTSPTATTVAHPRLPPADDHSDLGRLRTALSRFDFGDYASVVDELGALVESGALAKASDGSAATPGLPRADRLEALRAYAISCALIGRPTAAEGAFLLLLEADPAAQLDPAQVRPEAVTLFNAVRTRRADERLTVYKKSRGRRYVVLNLLPPAGQLQNRQYAKGYTLLGLEIALLGLNVSTASLLYAWRGDHQDFVGHPGVEPVLRPINWASFAALLGVLAYGIIDGFVVGHRRQYEEHVMERQLRGDNAKTRRGGLAALARHLSLDSPDGVGLRF